MHALHYFPLRARAEQIRMILAYGKIPYQNVVVEFDNWPQTKKDSKQCPFAQLPTMTLPSGLVIAQSGAITRYVAKLAGVYPTDPERAAKADMIQELAMEMNPINPVMNWFPVGSDQWNSLRTSYFAAFDARIAVAQSILGSEKYYGGNDKPSHADFCMFHILDATVTVQPDALNAYPTMQAWMGNMRAIPELQQYLTERPQPPHVGRDGSFLKTMKSE